MIENHTTIHLEQVVSIDKDKCVNCHACITACPVKYCNDGSGDAVAINPDMCIACGNCIEACTHGARYFIDDFDAFLHAGKSDEKMVAIASPSIAASFPEQYLQLNGWLKSMGVSAVFDVSFGAELSVKSYVEHIKEDKPHAVLAQPCPAIVSYIELYKPELLKYLAPADSPMLHTIKMIKNYYPQYTDHKIAVLSPCTAKKREFQETGMGDFNIAHISIYDYLKKHNINLADYPAEDFDNPDAERAVQFSTPGGLLQTLERWMPDARYNTRKIEGIDSIYAYLDDLEKMIDEGKAPLLIDCLNCDLGCNGGPLTVSKNQPRDEIEYYVNKRNREMRDSYLQKHKNDRELTQQEIEDTITSYWQKGIYKRDYVNLWQNVTLKYPTGKELENIYRRMHKYSDDDIYNCTACGYGSCEKMAIAIFNGLNRPENCHFYLATETEISHEETRASQNRLRTILDNSLEGFVQVDNDEIIVDANPAMKNILLKEDIVGRSIFEFVDEENKQIIRNQLPLRKEKQYSTYEVRFTQSSGDKIYCRVSGSPLFEGDEQIGSFAMVTNINELKIAQQELKEANEDLERRVKERTAELSDTIEELSVSQETIQEYNKELEKLSIVASKTDNVVILMDSETNIEWVNDGFEHMTGYTIMELYEKCPGKLSDCNMFKTFVKEAKNCKATHHSIEYESQLSTKQNDTLWLQTTLTPILSDEGEIERLVAIATNISRIKEAEKEILQQKEEINTQAEALYESQQQLNDIIELLPDAAFVIDKSGKVIYWNKAMREMTGVRENEITGKGNYEYALPFYGERRPILIDLVFKSIENFDDKYPTIQREGDILYAETYLPAMKNGDCYVNGTASALYNSKGEITGAIEIIRDITKRKKAEEELQQTNQELISKNHEIEQQKEEITTQAEYLKDLNTKLQTYSDELSQKNTILDQRNKEVTDSIKYAWRIQQALLPRSEQMSDFSDYFYFFRPKNIVSGDFFWHRKVDNTHVVVVADCTGHGVPGAFMSMLGISLLNELVRNKAQQKPADLLEDLRSNVKNVLSQDESQSLVIQDGMDVAVCTVDMENKKLQYAGAHNPLYMFRNGEFSQVKATPVPVGVFKVEKPFENHEIDIQKGDSFYMFSDGFQDQFGGPENKKYKRSNFRKFLKQIHTNDMKEQEKLLANEFDQWKGDDNPQIDDVIVMGFRV